MATAIEVLRRQTLPARGYGLGATAPAVANTGTQLTSATGGLAAATQQFIPGVPARQRTPIDAAEQVNRALSIYQQPVQESRQTAEAGVNSAIADSVRGGLAEQERLRNELRYPGLGKLERLRIRRAIAANQAGVNSGLEAIDAMRTGQVTARGQDLEAATAVTDREIAEQGAFDRGQLRLDETELRGQYGLGQTYLAGEMQNEGLVAQRTAMNPLEQMRFELARGFQQGIGTLPADQQLPTNAALLEYLGGQGGALAAATSGGGGVITLTDGTEIPVSDEMLMAYGAANDPILRKILENRAAIAAQEGAYDRVTGGQPRKRPIVGGLLNDDPRRPVRYPTPLPGTLLFPTG